MNSNQIRYAGKYANPINVNSSNVEVCNQRAYGMIGKYGSSTQAGQPNVQLEPTTNNSVAQNWIQLLIKMYPKKSSLM